MIRAILILLLTGLALACGLLLGGCTSPQRLEGSGVPAPAPIGHTVACAKDPGLAGCPK
jgi:hypothetical protein